MASRGQVYRRDDRPTWYARFRHAGRWVNRGGFVSQDSAETWLVTERLRIEREDLLGLTPVHSGMTFGAFHRRWLEWAEARWSSTTLESARQIVANVLLPELGDRHLGAVALQSAGAPADPAPYRALFS